MSRLSCRIPRFRSAGALAAAFWLFGWMVLSPAAAEVRVAAGLRVDVVVTGIPRPIQLAFDPSGALVVLSHGWRGEAAAEVYRLDLTAPLPLDASRAPRMVIPFDEGPRKAAFGSLAVDPRGGDLFFGEENGNRVYRLTRTNALQPFAVGLYYLVGGGSLAFDAEGRLVVLDFVSPEALLRSETPSPPALDWLTMEGYQGPLVFRLDPAEDMPLPRRLDLVAPFFPKASARTAAGEPLSRFVSVAASPGGGIVLLDSLGEIFRLTDGGLRLVARLPAGHYNRTNMAVAPDGSVFVSGGFHIRQVFRLSPTGLVTPVARELGDPGGLVVDRAGNLYIAETALHRIIRIRPAP